MEDSLFTRIIKGDIPCHKVYENDSTLAFMDINPTQPGHVVVVPKKQVNFVWDLQSPDYQALMSAVQLVGKKLKVAFPEKARIGVIIEGMGIDNHAHVNVIPFDTSEELRAIPDPKNEPQHAELAEMAARLSAA